VTVYSHSRLSTFEKCPLQYKYRYLDRIKRDTQGIEAFLGNRVHEALEKLYLDVQAEKSPGLDELIALYHGRWDERFSDRITIVKTEHTADHYRRVGERCIVDYYARYAPFDQDRTLGLEERIGLSLDDGGRYRLRGFIDRISRVEPGVYQVHDYKTSNSLPSERSLRKDRQLSFYQMAVEERFPDAREVRLVWHYLVFNRELRSHRTPADLEAQRAAAMQLIDTIERASEFPPHESALCRWCEYRDICPVQKHLVRVEAVQPEREEADAAGGPESQPEPRGATKSESQPEPRTAERKRRETVVAPGKAEQLLLQFD
jgi:putative RecB family exonuclease